MINTWQRTSPLAVIFYLLRFGRFLITDGLAMMAPAVAWYATASGPWKIWAAAWFGVLALAGIVGAVLSYLRFRYRITDNQVLVRRGVLNREQLNIDFDRIQDTAIDEPFYVRPFGLAVLKLDTAGSAKKEIALAGISVELATRIRNTLLAFRSSTDDPQRPPESLGGSDAESAVSEPPSTTLLERSNREIVRYGLTANGLLWVVVVFGVLVGAFGDNAWDGAGRWVLNRLRMGTMLAGIEVSTPLLIAAGLVGIPLLLALFSVVGALWRYANYHLATDGSSFRRTSGLISRQQQTLKASKVQAAVWKQNILARMLGITNLQLRLVSAGEEVNANGMPAATPAFLVPALKDPERIPVTRRFLPQVDEAMPAFTGIHRAYHLRRSLWMWALPLAGITFAWLWIIGIWALLIPIAGLALAVAIIWQRGKKFGVAVRGQSGYLRHGFIGAHTAVFPLFKIQRVDVAQSPGQRRRRLATLTVHLASHSITIPHLTLADARQFADVALYHAESSTQAWF